LKSKLFLISLLSFLILSFSIVHASQVQTVQVSPLSEKTLVFNLDDGDKFTGSLSISGGSGNDIDFRITDPQGTTVLGLGRVSQGKTFEFTAQASGAYTLHFDNSFSLISSKAVTISYDISKPILGGGFDSNSLLIIMGVIIIVIVIVVLAVGLSRRKNTQRTNLPPPPPSNP
jgi:hypothetical protein